jgi:hypothetical protein
MPRRPWDVWGYARQSDGRGTSEIAWSELTEFFGGPSEEDATALMGWMMALQNGRADPVADAALSAPFSRLRYRCMGNVVMIFAVAEEAHEIHVLRFCIGSLGHPIHADLVCALQRLQEWSAGVTAR